MAFLKRIEGARSLFASADKDTLPALDMTAQFRPAQPPESPERGGGQIIEWTLRVGTGSPVFHYRGSPQTSSQTVRWHYGDPIALSLRYAKDSPNVQLAPVPAGDAKIDSGNRTVSYEYNQNWALFALLLGHAASKTDFEPLAAVPNTIRLRFGNSPGPADTELFYTFFLQAPAAKDAQPKPGATAASIAIAPLPSSAPTLQ